MAKRFGHKSWELLRQSNISKTEEGRGPDQITVAQLDAVLASWGKTGLGLDHWDPRELKGLPKEGKQELVDMLSRIETLQVWPIQSMSAIIALLGKPQGGERPITLLVMLYRIWSKIRKADVASWEAARVGFWDTAIRGNSALRIASLRRLKNEFAVAKFDSTAALLWDCEKFHDSISLREVLEGAARVEYPDHCICMAVLMHISPRILRANGCCSDPIEVDTGILAGCSNSNSMAGIGLYQILEFYHIQHPAVPVQSYVGDLTQNCRGSRKQIMAQLVPAAGTLVTSLEGNKFRISKKSTFTTSDAALGQMIHKELAQQVIEVTLGSSSKDLGIGTAAGGRRTAKVLNGRVAKTKNRTKKVKRLLKVNKKASKLFSTGIYPQVTWGHSASGMPPSTLKTIRAMAAATTAVSMGGKCSTTSVAITHGIPKDLAIRIRIEHISEWAILWGKLNETRKKKPIKPGQR